MRRYQMKQPMKTSPISVLTSIEAFSYQAMKRKSAATSATPGQS